MSLTVWESVFMWQCLDLALNILPLHGGIEHFSPTAPAVFSSWLDQGLFFAQSVRDVDILGDFQDAWNNFVKSG
ncbi:hypothetical protein IQ225_08345, partial [Synechocystis salina LEGE 06155]|nr:hypothetical protein [Synechocystis salina LEGE 06155]